MFVLICDHGQMVWLCISSNSSKQSFQTEGTQLNFLLLQQIYFQHLHMGYNFTPSDNDKYYRSCWYFFKPDCGMACCSCQCCYILAPKTLFQAMAKTFKFNFVNFNFSFVNLHVRLNMQGTQPSTSVISPQTEAAVSEFSLYNIHLNCYRFFKVSLLLGG